MQIPTIEAFYHAQTLADDYKVIHTKTYNTYFYSLGDIKNVDILDVIKQHGELRKQVFEETLNRHKQDAVQWLKEQPAFLNAYPELVAFANESTEQELIAKFCILVKKHFYKNTERYQGTNEIERINFHPNLISQTPNDLTTLLTYQKKLQNSSITLSIFGLSTFYDNLARINDYDYIDVLANLARFSFLYLSGSYKEKAIELRKYIKDLKKLIQRTYKTLDKLVDNRYQLAEIQKYALPYDDYKNKTRTAIQKIEELEEEQLLMGSRKDQSLAERMMILDIIRLNLSIFCRYEKRRIYRVMELPFIKNPVEMNTIVRLIREEQKLRVKRAMNKPSNQ